MIEDAQRGGQRSEDGGQPDDAGLLRRYVQEKSEAAFAELVRRHVNFVYGCARRRVGGDTHLAEDVTQHVFTALAREAAALTEREGLSGWLFITARNVSAQLVRTERRRHAREQEVYVMNEITSEPGGAAEWERLRPMLDRALDDLSDDDRRAVLLRFYEGKPFAEVGARLCLAENTARMRVERALEKLRVVLARHGVTSTTAALGAALAQEGLAAPPGLASAVTAAALAGTTSVGGKVAAAAGLGLWSFMSMSKIVGGAAALVVALAVGVATHDARETTAARAELAATARQSAELQQQLDGLEARLAATERRAQSADADATQLLKAIQATAPTFELPPGDATCLAFVIDSSGSMRDPNTHRLWAATLVAVDEMLAAHPQATHLMAFDSSGRFMLGGPKEWLRRTPQNVERIKEAIWSYPEDSISNPVPGIYLAMRTLPKAGTNAQLHVCVIGDEFNTTEQQPLVLQRLEQLNPADARGRRRATISTLQLPTTIRFDGGRDKVNMGNTGIRFQMLMTEVAKQHGGTYRLLPEL